MRRRDFLQVLAASILAGTVNGGPLRAAGGNWKDQFHAALGKNPWLLGYRSVEKPIYTQTSLPIEGQLPPELKGVFYRNGPAQHEHGDLRYHHWFDGDGMVHAYHFDGQTVTHRARMVETEKYLREQEAGRSCGPPAHLREVPRRERVGSCLLRHQARRGGYRHHAQKQVRDPEHRRWRRGLPRRTGHVEEGRDA